MNKYIIEILKVQSSVILPGLGALMIASTKTGKVVFNPHLKFNDGSLAKFIAEKEGIDKQEAENQVAKFVREIEAELGKGGKYEIFDFGHFHMNKDNQVDFTMKDAAQTAMAAGDEKPKSEPKKVEAKKEEPKKEAPKKEEKKKEAAKKEEPKKAEKKKEEDKKSTEEPKKEDKKANSFVPGEKKEEAKKEEPKKEEDKKSIPVVGATKAETPQDKNTFVPKTDEKKAEEKPKTTIAGVSAVETKTTDSNDKAKTTIAAAKPNKPGVKPKPTPKKKEKKEGKKRKAWPWIVLILILGGGGTAGYFYQEQIKSFFYTGVDDDHGDVENGDHDNQESNENNELAVIETDTSTTEVIDTTLVEEVTEEIVEEVIEETPEKVIKEPVVNQPTNASGSYHVIGNAFADKSNAEGYVSSMSSKGYSAQILGRFDNLYLVALKSYDSRSAAESGLSSVSSDSPSAWVFKYSK